MNTEAYKDSNKQDRIVYVRAVSVEDLPSELRDQIQEGETLYAVHKSDGERLALVKDRQMAFMLARQNDLSPVTVH